MNFCEISFVEGRRYEADGEIYRVDNRGNLINIKTGIWIKGLPDRYIAQMDFKEVN